MIKPACYNIDFYQGVDFDFDFRLKTDGSYVDLSTYTIVFSASSNSGGTNILSYSSADSPSIFSYDADENFLVTMLIPRADIEALTDNELYYTIDITDTAGLKQRYMQGNIYVHEGASG